MLNSDTIVTEHWLSRLHDGLMRAGPKAMIAGPLSNAASYQSIPLVKDGGKWHVNPLPAGLDVDTLGREVSTQAASLCPESVPMAVLNGFCFMVKRELLETIGGFDEVHFPRGYGEEVDLSLRAYEAGYTSVVIPSVYVFHRKTSSFSMEIGRAHV
jgi:GT2 family glycosyltransferase